MDTIGHSKASGAGAGEFVLEREGTGMLYGRGTLCCSVRTGAEPKSKRRCL